MPKAAPGTKKLSTSRFQRVGALRCYGGLKERAVAGWPIVQLVKYVKDDQKELLDLEPEEAFRLLSDWRKSLPPGDFLTTATSNVAQQRMTPIAEKAIERVESGLDEVEELERLYRMQLKRMEIDFNAEKKAEKLFATMTQEIRVAKEILQTSAQLKMDLGVSKRHIGTVEIDGKLVTDAGKRYGSAAVAQVLASAESRQRVMAVAERLLLANGQAPIQALDNLMKGADADTDALADEIIEGEATPIEDTRATYEKTPEDDELGRRVFAPKSKSTPQPPAAEPSDEEDDDDDEGVLFGPVMR